MQAEHTKTILQTGLWADDGTVDFSKSLDLAQSIIDTWPDDPAAEYARLHLLQLSNHPGSTQHNTDETMERIVDIIEHTQDALVLDVKVGRGAFMKTRERARELAKALVRVGAASGKKVSALLTDMSAPLGATIGNAMETREAIEVLHGGGGDTTPSETPPVRA